MPSREGLFHFLLSDPFPAAGYIIFYLWKTLCKISDHSEEFCSLPPPPSPHTHGGRLSAGLEENKNVSSIVAVVFARPPLISVKSYERNGGASPPIDFAYLPLPPKKIQNGNGPTHQPTNQPRDGPRDRPRDKVSYRVAARSRD